MGLSISILVSAWDEIFMQKFFSLLSTGAATTTSTSSTSSSTTSPSFSTPATCIAKQFNFKRSSSFKKAAGPHTSAVSCVHSQNDNKAMTSTETTTTFKNCKPDNVAVFEKSLSFKDFLKESFSRGANGLFHKPLPAISLPPDQPPPFVFSSPRPAEELDAAAVTVQKIYKSYRTRRNLADCAVVVEELWWKALDFAALKRSSVSFFNDDKQETAHSRWARTRIRVAKLGKGLSKDDKAQKLALQHWLEAIDPRHRYGHNLHLYYDVWFESESAQPFFYWLDVGDGKELNLESCPRTKLQHQCIKYLGPKEREAYEVIVEDGKLVYRQSGAPVDTVPGSKWIFVLSTSRTLYIGQKLKGTFQHSSFLAGAATTAAGRLVAHGGVLEAIWPYSGHYLPTEENFREFISFLAENQVDLYNVKRYTFDEQSRSFKVAEDKLQQTAKPSKPIIHDSEIDQISITANEGSNGKPPLFDFSKRLSCKWTTGHGPRIGCVRDYPFNLQSQALEQVNLSPRRTPRSAPACHGPIPSPRPSPKVRLSPRLAYMGLPSPRTRISAAN